MSKYWPVGLELSDTQSPLEILHDAQAEWESNSSGVLALIIQEAESQSGYDMIVIHAKHVSSNRTASLFSVVSRKGHPYPARLQPKGDELPNFFKKCYKTRNLSSLAAIGDVMGHLSEERWVNNKWVADTPSEFREKLEEVFNLGDIKSEILNLISADGVRKDDKTDKYKDADDVIAPESTPLQTDTESE
ncbi:MAG: hypothetical protein RLN60_03530 [Phycisphaerales bacterium]